MQTAGKRGMQTLEQALVDLVQRGIVSREAALQRSSRPDQLLGLLERGGGLTTMAAGGAVAGGLRAAGS
jgi:twitching motility protein PilT